MVEIILDTLLDALKILPFLYVTFLIMEYVEHKFSKKSKNKIARAGRFGPLVGSLLGAVPQCGFSVMATNLYATRIITLGTLMAVFLSTSDEMLPILISHGTSFPLIFEILIIKIIIGIVAGFVIDFLLRKKSENKDYEIRDFCLEHHCDCDHSIIKSSVKHTLNIILFIIVVTFILNLGISYLGEKNISKIFLKDSFLSPFISSLVGLIPNCGASVILTELYLKKVISFASCISGLLTGSGVALLVLFKANKNVKENTKIILMLYLIGAMSGVLIQIVQSIL